MNITDLLKSHQELCDRLAKQPTESDFQEAAKLLRRYVKNTKEMKNKVGYATNHRMVKILEGEDEN